MEKNNKPAGVTSNLNGNAKNKRDRYAKASGIGTGIFLIVLGLAALYGWWKLEPTPLRVILYVVAVLSIGLASFGIVEELTAKAKSNYSMAAMLFTWFAFLMYASGLTDIRALQWLSLASAIFFGLVAIVALVVQANKDIRKRPALRWVIAIPLIPGLSVVSAWYFAWPVVLCLIPFTLIVLYSEYLRTTFLNGSITEV